MSNLSTDILMQLVRARYTCLMQLRELGIRQLALIDQDNVTALLDLLSAKQKPLNDIQRIERALDPYRSEDPQQRPWHSLEDRANCAGLVKKCETLLKEIVAAEKQCEETMLQKREATAIRLRQLRSAGQAHEAYTSAGNAGLSQIDLSSDS
jgi:hypothetical protein